MLIFIPFAISLGYDSVVGGAIPFLGSAVGFAVAFFNPFTVGIAQGFDELPLYSGLAYRLVLWVIATIIAIVFVMIYAEKVRKNPELSLVYDTDRAHQSSGEFSLPLQVGLFPETHHCLSFYRGWVAHLWHIS